MCTTARRARGQETRECMPFQSSGGRTSGKRFGNSVVLRCVPPQIGQNLKCKIHTGEPKDFRRPEQRRAAPRRPENETNQLRKLPVRGQLCTGGCCDLPLFLTHSLILPLSLSILTMFSSSFHASPSVVQRDTKSYLRLLRDTVYPCCWLVACLPACRIDDGLTVTKLEMMSTPPTLLRAPRR